MSEEASWIAGFLQQTLTPDDGTAVRTATESLDRLSLELPHFPFLLLSVASGCQNPSLRVAAATYLKNFTRRSIGTGGTTSEVSKEFKDQLIQALLQVEPTVLKVLLEVLRSVIVAEFVKQNSWPQLVPELRSAIENSNLISSSSNSKWSTVNALMVLLTVVKPFQYFLTPKVSKEPVPQQLESITNGILVPLVPAFHLFVEKALTTQGRKELETEKILHIICKCLYCALRSHMPSALPPLLGSLSRDMIRVLESLSFDQNVNSADGYMLRLKTGKRSLLIFSALVTRHRKYSNRLMSDIVDCLLKIVRHSSNIIGWRLLSPRFSFLLDSAVFPVLVLNERDISEWEEDADEFIRKNLPSEIGPPVSTSNAASSIRCKRKKGENNRRTNQKSSMGELFCQSFLYPQRTTN